MTRTLCDFVEIGDEIVCRNCETRRPIAKRGLYRYCGPEATPVVRLAKPAKARDRKLAVLAPKATDLTKLAELLKPCKCPTAKIEHRARAAKMLADWPAPAELDDGDWAVGVTTAPRDASSIATTLRALNVNGWKPTVFAEPGSPDFGDADYAVEQNVIRLGAWHNWRNAAMRLLQTGAEKLLIVQDDTWIVPGTRLFLDRMAWPKDAAFVSLYVAGHQAPKGPPAVVPIDVKGVYWGACAWAFKRDALLRVLMSDSARGWRGVGKDRVRLARKDDEVRNIDTCVTRTIRELKLKAYAVTPSASQHVAPTSSIWGTPEQPRADTGKRAAGSVVADWAAFDKPWPKTGDADFDVAADAWGRLVGRPSYPIPLGLWNELRGRLGPGKRVLELGSGLSTRLLRSTGADVTSVEQNPVIAAYSGATYAPLVDGWYDWTPTGSFDVVLIDGPARKGREGILRHLPGLVAPGGVVIVDDAHRPAEKQLAKAISPSAEFKSESGRGWAVVTFPGSESVAA